jgi:hypothetical protein
MNRTLPTRDRGDRSGVTGGVSRSPGLVSSAVGLVGRTPAATRRPDEEKPPRVNPGGWRKWLQFGESALERITSLAVRALHGRDCQAHLPSQGTANESTHAVSLPVRRFHDFCQASAILALQQVQNPLGLAAFAGGWLLLALGRFLPLGGLLGRLALGGRDVGALLLTARSIEEAASTAGVTPRTLFRWQKEPEFDAAYRAAKRASFGQSIARLHHLCNAAVSTLGKVMLDPATPPATKVRAADSILDHTTKAIEIEDIEARVSELEHSAENAKQRR